MALNPLNSSNLEHLALKSLRITAAIASHVTWQLRRRPAGRLAT